MELEKQITREKIEQYLNEQVLAKPFLKINEETLAFITKNFGEDTKDYILVKMEEALKAANQVNSCQM